MPIATDDFGALIPLNNCYIEVPNAKGSFETVQMDNLPEISDSKGASYSDEVIIGRAMPLKTYSHSENRVITTKINFFIYTSQQGAMGSARYNLAKIRLLQSACYPVTDPMQSLSVPYAPPPICKLKCGSILADQSKDLCVVLVNYSTSYPTDVAWDSETGLPYKVTMDCTWHVVYRNSDLPGQSRIITEGR